jgi:membrane protein DedA with SNARE-associated domain
MFDLITRLVEQTGYLGIALLMLAENVFPPIPSELIMPLAGFTAAQGKLGILGVVLAGVLGSLVGALLWYEAGRRLGLERLRRWTGRYGRWFTLEPEDLDQATVWFRAHCGQAVLIGRLVPAVRTLISVPAGIADMPLPRFLLYSGIGTALWTTVLTLAGYALEDRYQDVQAWLNPVSNVILGGLLAWYVYRVVTFRPREARAAE